MTITFNNVLDSFGKNVALIVIVVGILLLIMFLLVEYIESNKSRYDNKYWTKKYKQDKRDEYQ